MTTPQTLKTVTALLVVLLVALGLGCGYLYVASASAARAISAQQAALKQARQQTEERMTVTANLSRLKAQMPERPQGWDWSQQMPEMVDQIDKLFAACGTKVETLQKSPSTAKQGLTRFPLRVTLHTDLDRLTALLNKMQGASPALAVDHLVIRNGEKPEEPLQVECTLTAYALVNAGAGTGGRR